MLTLLIMGLINGEMEVMHGSEMKITEFIEYCIWHFENISSQVGPIVYSVKRTKKLIILQTLVSQIDTICVETEITKMIINAFKEYQNKT